MKLEECLKQLMIDDFGSVSKFADSIGVPRTTVYNALNRGVSGSGHELVEKIYSTLGVDWRVIGFDDDHDYAEFKRRRDDLWRSKNRSDLPIIKPTYSYAVMPVVGDIAAGDPCEAIELIDQELTVPEAFLETHPEARFLRVRGESMNKLFQADSYVLYDPELPVRDGDIAVVYVNGDDATVKRVYFAGDTVVLHPESTMEEHLDRAINTKDPASPPVTFAGRVIWSTWGDREVKF